MAMLHMTNISIVPYNIAYIDSHTIDYFSDTLHTISSAEEKNKKKLPKVIYDVMKENMTDEVHKTKIYYVM